MLTFDEFGQLTPDQPIESELSAVENVFVFNETRRLIFAELLGFLEIIKSWEIGHFQVWLDGSFVTKKELPRDVDIAVFMDAKSYERNENLLYLVKKTPLIDAYFISVYPEDHPLFHRTESDLAYWFNLFSKDRKRRRKGFIQINF